MRRTRILALVGFLCVGAIAIAQTTPILNLIGTETLNITLGSGSGITIPLNQVRNTGSITTVAAGSTVTSAPTLATNYLIATGAITVPAVERRPMPREHAAGFDHPVPSHVRMSESPSA